MTKTSNEVNLHEVMEWAQGQSHYLRSSSLRLVLWYLTANAFRHESNPEQGIVGQVLGARTEIAAIQRGTGLSDKTVRAALQELQSLGYIAAKMTPGRGRSSIVVFWTEAAEQMRDDARKGIKPLPKWTQRSVQETTEEQVDAVVLSFRNR